jgi:hypothetical protein
VLSAGPTPHAAPDRLDTSWRGVSADTLLRGQRPLSIDNKADQAGPPSKVICAALTASRRAKLIAIQVSPTPRPAGSDGLSWLLVRFRRRCRSQKARTLGGPRG